MKSPFRPRFELLEPRQMLSAADLTGWSGVGNLSSPNNYSVTSSGSAGGLLDGRRNGAGETAGYLADTLLSVSGGVLSATTAGGFSASGSLSFDASTDNSSIVDPVFYFGFFDKDSLASGAFGFTIANQTATSFRFRASAGTTQTTGTGSIVSQGDYTFDLDVNNADSGANKVRFRLFNPTTLASVLDVNVTIPGALALQADSFGFLQPTASTDADVTFGLTVSNINYSGESQIQAPVDSADFDDDGDVDGADFLTWQRGLGLGSQTGNGNGDANHNGVVNGADLAVWATQFGAAAPATAPAAPSGLTATAAGTSQINLTWIDNADNETAFEIDRATNSAFTTGLVSTTALVNTTSYAANGLDAGATYYFRVRATNAVGDSGNSNTANATTTPVAGSIFYISLTGSDSNNGTTAGAAWATLDKALRTAPANSTVFLQAGTYSAGQTTLTNPGRTGKVTFKPAAGAIVTLAGLIDWKNVTDVRLEGLRFTNSVQVRETENFEFVDNDVTNASLNIYGIDGGLLEGNFFHGYTLGYNAILLRSYNSFLIPGSAPRDFRAEDVVIRNNILDLNNQAGDAIHVESGSNVLIEKNVIRNVLTTDLAHGDSIQLVEVDTSTITGNIISNGRGIIVHHFLTATGANINPYIPGVNHDLIFTNNVHTSGLDFSLRLHEAPNAIVANNTFWATGTTAGHSLDIGRNSTNIVLANNIVRVLRVDATVTYAVRGSNLIGAIFGTTRLATELSGTPTFVNYAAGDLRLQSSSLGVNQGMTGTFVPTLDRDGGVRVGLPDMGAYEFTP